ETRGIFQLRAPIGGHLDAGSFDSNPRYIAAGRVHAEVADMDNDGLPDVLAYFPGTIEGIAPNRSTPGTLFFNGGVAFNGNGEAADVDADGRLDFVSVHGLYQNETMPGILEQTSFR